LAKGLRLVAFLVLPSTLGLVLLAEPIVSVLYERGAFDATDRLQTAGALRAYGYGLLFYAWLKVLQPAFYAIDKRWLPMMVSFFALGLNLGFNYFFVFVMQWGHESLALTTSITASVNFIILFLAMRKFAGDLGTLELLLLFGKLLFAGVMMGGVCLAANRFLFADLAATGFVIKVIYLGLTIGVASTVYFVAAKLMQVSEARDALEMITRKLKR
jgi:putative peptidoglycan lipid II flippase